MLLWGREREKKKDDDFVLSNWNSTRFNLDAARNLSHACAQPEQQLLTGCMAQYRVLATRAHVVDLLDNLLAHCMLPLAQRAVFVATRAQRSQSVCYCNIYTYAYLYMHVINDE